ncbi:hypothetical protein S83_038824, partial [Arachis hypogaea]
VSFTGSMEVGREIMHAAASSNLKQVSLELVGKSPLLIFDDADVDKAASLALLGIVYNKVKFLLSELIMKKLRNAIDSSLSKQWLHNLQSEIGILADGTLALRQILIQGVDMFGKRIGFLKFDFSFDFNFSFFLKECLEMRKRYVFKEAVAPWDKEVISDPSTPKPNPQLFFYAPEGKSDHYFEMQDGVIHVYPNKDYLYYSCISKKLKMRILADSCFTSWSWSMCWNNCHVRNLSNGYGSRQDNCTDLFYKSTATFFCNIKFPLQVASFPFDDYNCPPLQLVISFCHSAYSWLKLDIENVVVVHCKAGMNKDLFYPVR